MCCSRDGRAPARARAPRLSLRSLALICRPRAIFSSCPTIAELGDREYAPKQRTGFGLGSLRGPGAAGGWGSVGWAAGLEQVPGFAFLAVYFRQKSQMFQKKRLSGHAVCNILNFTII